MTALREAAKQALEALEHIQRCIGFATATIHQGSATWCQSEDAIASIKAALAQQREQQPVCHGCGIPADVHMSTCKSGKWPSRVSNGDTAAPAPQPAQGEPVAWAIYDNRGGSKSIHWAEQHTDGNAEMYNAVPLYTVAPAPVEQRCTYCDGTGDVHSIDGEWRGTCPCAAAPAPQAQEPMAWRTEALKWIRRKAEDQRAAANKKGTV